MLKDVTVNEEYAQRLIEAANLVEDSVLMERCAHIIDLIDFNQIKNVCDIGSRFLEQAIEWAHVLPTANIYAFEPVPESYSICCDNYNNLNEDQKNRIHIYDLALNNQSGTIPFYPVNNTGSEYNLGASSKYKFKPGLNGSFFGKTWNQTEITVKAQTLDEWRLENNITNIDVLWMDVQGGELDVLKGAVETLKNVKVIFTEVGTGAYYEGQSLKPEIDSFLEDNGFEELKSAWQVCHQYEGNAIYLKK